MAKQKEIKRPLFWITGNFYDCRKRWGLILEFLKNPNVISLESGSSSDSRVAKSSDIIKLLKNRDMFDSRPRVIRVNGLPEDYAIMSDYLRLVSSDNVLVFYGPIGHAKTSKFFKTFSSEGMVWEYPIIAETESIAKDWIAKVSSELGHKINPDAVELLVQHKGKNLDTLYSDLTCLIDYHEGKSITIEDVRDVCVPLFLKTTWDLVDSIDRQDYEESAAHLQQFYAGAGVEVGTTFYGEAQKLLGALHHHFEFMMYIKDCKNLSYNTVAEVVKGIKKRTKEGNKYTWEQDSYSSNFLYQAIKKKETRNILSWPKNKLDEIMLDLLRTIFLCRTKYSGNEEGIKLCLDSFLMVACGKLGVNGSSVVKGYRRWAGRI